MQQNEWNGISWDSVSGRRKGSKEKCGLLRISGARGAQIISVIDEHNIFWNCFRLHCTLFTNAKMLSKPNSSNGNDVRAKFASFASPIFASLGLAVCVLALHSIGSCALRAADVDGCASVALLSVAVFSVRSTCAAPLSAIRSKYSSKSSTLSVGRPCGAVDVDVNRFSYCSNSAKSNSKPFIENGFVKSVETGHLHSFSIWAVRILYFLYGWLMGAMSFPLVRQEQSFAYGGISTYFVCVRWSFS